MNSAAILILLIGLSTANAACFRPLGMISSAIKDEQITASSAYSSWTRPAVARLQSPRQKSSPFGGWCAGENDNSPFLQIDLLRDAAISGVATQGLAAPPGNWVTHYAVNYSCDGKVWSSYEERGKPAILTGNRDSDTAIRSNFQTPFVARVLRIIPMKWKAFGLVCMRVETYGCYLKDGKGYGNCNAPVGLEDGTIQDYQMTASSHVNGQVASRGRLHEEFSHVNGTATWGGWCTDKLDKLQYLEIDLGLPRNVSGVATQGFAFGGWVTAFLVKYSVDGVTWKAVKDEKGNPKIFPGNKNRNTVVANRLYHICTVCTAVARYIRFNPVNWATGKDICMRVEVYACTVQKGCPQRATTTASPTTVITGQTKPMTQSKETTEKRTKTRIPTAKPTPRKPTTSSESSVAQLTAAAESVKLGSSILVLSLYTALRVLS